MHAETQAVENPALKSRIKRKWKKEKNTDEPQPHAKIFVPDSPLDFDFVKNEKSI
jgi:hypothetical protein